MSKDKEKMNLRELFYARVEGKLKKKEFEMLFTNRQTQFKKPNTISNKN